MSPNDCLFCELVRSGSHIRQADGFVAFEDINPKAEVHILIVPERHIDTFRQIGELPPEEALRMLVFIADTARALSLEDYRVLCTVGSSAGQTVFHLHWHLLGGRDLGGRLPALALAEAEGED
ncbi:MAG TPA: HIT domain-containing protein [Gaiellaceae bacterium]|jgi:histidine triad (HIT) family protein